MLEKIILEKKDGIGVIRLNRPEVMNAVDEEVEEELAKAIHNIRVDENIKVLIITGTGRAFCSGGDVRTMNVRSPDQSINRLRKMHRILLDLINLEKPVIAAVNGLALGVGCNLALASDIIIASESAKFAQSFIKLGLVPDGGGMYFLPRLVGLPRSKELMFIGEMIDAKEAEKIGMVNRVVPNDSLEIAVKELARKIAMGPSKAIGLIKTILNQSHYMDLDKLFELEVQAQTICANTDDHKQKVREFVERKKT